MSSDDTISDEEWERRQLCSDGNCIGVIGPDGLCTECGKPGKKVEIPKAMPLPPAASEEAPTGPAEAPASVDEDVDAKASGAADVPEEDDDWAKRRLCPDGNCIGVIGPDGKCKECGRPAE